MTGSQLNCFYHFLYVPGSDSSSSDVSSAESSSSDTDTDQQHITHEVVATPVSTLNTDSASSASPAVTLSTTSKKGGKTTKVKNKEDFVEVKSRLFPSFNQVSL